MMAHFAFAMTPAGNPNETVLVPPAELGGGLAGRRHQRQPVDFATDSTSRSGRDKEHLKGIRR
jgi:hypothetical protein